MTQNLKDLKQIYKLSCFRTSAIKYRRIDKQANSNIKSSCYRMQMNYLVIYTYIKLHVRVSKSDVFLILLLLKEKMSNHDRHIIPRSFSNYTTIIVDTNRFVSQIIKFAYDCFLHN